MVPVELRLSGVLHALRHVPPADADSVPAFRSVLEAPPAERAAFLEAYLRRCADEREDLRVRWGKYIDRCLERLLVHILDDETTDFPPGYSARLWRTRHVLPKHATWSAVSRLVRRDGWSPDLADEVVGLTRALEDAIAIVEAAGDADDWDEESARRVEAAEERMDQLGAEHLAFPETSSPFETPSPVVEPMLQALARSAEDYLRAAGTGRSGCGSVSSPGTSTSCA